MADPTNCGAEARANAAFAALDDEVEDFTLPDIDLTLPQYQLPDQTGNFLYNNVTKISNADLTSQQVGGTGTFDVIMKANRAHLKEEYDAGRITGDQYAKVYVELTTAALSSAVQFLLGKDQAYWSAVTSQLSARAQEVQAVIAAVQLQTAKTQLALAFIEKFKAQADYALTKMNIAIADANYCQAIAQTEQVKYQTETLMPTEVEQLRFNIDTMLPLEQESKVLENSAASYNNTNILPEQYTGLVEENRIKTYQVDNVLPSQVALTDAQELGVDAETAIKAYQLSDIMPSQKADIVADTAIKTYQVATFLPAQVLGIEADTDIKEYQLDNILPQELLVKQAQVELVNEQVEVQRAQTLDTRTDGTTTIVGAIGKQKDLYTQQITSYQRDSEYKVAKMYMDSWITQKTIDEGIQVPPEFDILGLNSILEELRTNNNFDPSPSTIPLSRTITGVGTPTVTITFSEGYISDDPQATVTIAVEVDATAIDGEAPVVGVKFSSTTTLASNVAEMLNGLEDAGTTYTLSATANDNVVTVTQTGGTNITTLTAVIS